MMHITQSAYRRFKNRIGKRGACLIAIGVVWIMTGIGMFTVPPSPIPGYYLYSHWYYARAIAWIVSGALGILFSWKPQGRDWIGWASVMVMAVFQCLAYFQGWFDALITRDGDWRGLIGGLGYVAIATLLRITASWKEPDRTLEGRDDQ